MHYIVGLLRAPGKALRQLPEPVEGVEVWALAVAGQRIGVQPDALEAVHGRLGEVVVVSGGLGEGSLG